MAATKPLKIPTEAFLSPRDFNKIVDRETYRGYMLGEQGRIFANGMSWMIIGQDLGAGLFRVKLVRDLGGNS